MKKLKKVLHLIFLFIMLILIVGSSYISLGFPDATVDELLFYLNNGVSNSDSSVFIIAILICLPIILGIYLIIVGIFYDLSFHHKFKHYPFKFINERRGIFTIIFSIITLLIICFNFQVFDLIKYNISNSKFIEENYVDPGSVNMEFGDKKNVIIIISESLESTLMDEKNGGKWAYNVTPELSKLMNEDDSVSFMSDTGSNGMKMLKTSFWTTASIITNTTGLPFKFVASKRFTSNDFLNGAYTLGDLLYDNGYHNEVISSANTSFGALKEYFQKHGKYDIIDIDSYQNYNLSLTDDDLGSWGFNDNYLFKAAKERLKVLSKEDEPFNLTLITIDTHFPDGYIGNYSVSKYKKQYENVYATQSKLIYDFVKWVKKQDFYKDTVIVVIGDHLSMQKDFFKKIDKDDRHIYACYINAQSEAINTKTRIYTSLDTYPTILGAMGVSIEGNKIGLGVNMFSKEKTLAETFGFKKLDKELQKKSNFYNKKILN